METEDYSQHMAETMEIEPESYILNYEVFDSNSYGVAKIIQCELCQQMFTNKLKMTIHWIINHSYKLCQLCSHFAFKYDSDKIQHEQQHLPFGCSSCNHEFNSIEEDVICEHYKKSHGSYLCKFCSSVVNPISMYSDHMSKKHNVNDVNMFDFRSVVLKLEGPDKRGKDWFFCKLCNKKREMNVLFGHFMFHHNFSIHAFRKVIEDFPSILINGFIARDENESTSDVEEKEGVVDIEVDENICKICDKTVDEDGSNVHGVFCKGLIICKEKECEQLFKDEKELTHHLKIEHTTLATCKFGCTDTKLKSTEIDSHLEELHDIVECYLCNIVNSSGNFKNHLRDNHSVNLVSYEKAVSKRNNSSKLYRVEITKSRIKSKKKKVLCNLCDEDITREILEFSFVNHYKDSHMMKHDGILRNLDKNPILDILLQEKQEAIKQKEFFKHFKVEVDVSSMQKMVETDFDTSKVSCIGIDDHMEKSSEETNHQCEFCKMTSFDASCQLYSHLKDSHGFQLLNVRDYCTTCELRIIKENENSDEEETKDFNLSLVCPLDQSYHVTKNNYKDHMLFDHSNPKITMDKIIYKCLECNFTYNELDEIREHFKNSHPSVLMTYCRICRYRFNNVSDSSTHFGENHSDELQKMFSCKLCKKAFKEEHIAKRHYESLHSKKFKATEKNAEKTFKPTLKCMICDELFACNQDRKLHLMLSHPDDKVFKCSKCPAQYKSKGSLSSHSLSVHKNTEFKCEYCSKTFSRRDSYKEHLLIHSSVRHKCSFCDKNFVQRSNLIRHERIHLGEKPYTCTFCDKTFSDKGACKSHENVHTKANVSFCDICGKQYAKKQKLKYHMRTHSRENILTCNRCGKIFTESYTFKKHQETHRNLRLECQHCFKRYKTEKARNEHARKIHNVDQSYPYIETKIVCTICNHEASSPVEIEDHLKTIHLVENVGDWQNYVRNVEFEMGEELA